MINLSMNRIMVIVCAMVFVLMPASIAAQPEVVWTIEMGDSLCYFTSVGNTTDGGFILTGPHSDSLWIVRIDSEGDTLWTIDLNVDPNSDGVDDPIVMQASDGGFIMASSGDPWLVKFDADGVKLWEQARSSIGVDTSDGFDGYYIMDMIELDDGSLVFSGGYRYADTYSMFIKTSSTGVVSWVNSFGRGIGFALIENSAGVLVSAGLFPDSTGTGREAGLLKLSTDGDSLSLTSYYRQPNDSLAYHLVSIEETADNGYIMAGRAGDENNNQRYYAALADADGKLVWENVAGGGFVGEAYFATQVDTLFMVSGMGTDTTTDGTGGPWTLLLSNTGETLWAGNFDLPGASAAMDIAEVGPGEYLMAGIKLISYEPFRLNGYLIRLTFNGITVSIDPVLPLGYYLQQNYPNPFNPTTTISYALPERTAVNLTVFDIRGQEVVILQEAEKPAGHYEVQWNGVDQSGNAVSTGVYFTRLQTGAYSETIKMVYLK